MDTKMIIFDLRRKFSMNGWWVLLYYGIMNLLVSIVTAVDVLLIELQYSWDPDGSFTDSMQTIEDRIAGNGWGCVLACLVVGLILLVWQKPDFYLRKIWVHEKNMTGKSLFVVFCAFLAVQAVQILMTPVIEWLLNKVGLSALASLEAASAGIHTVSMFLYVSLFAPVFEEIFFRGFILRNLLPYGKKFAIVASSFLFGILHGNLIQSPYAFLVGLVLGYTAVEYGLMWSVTLHIFNNFVLGDLATRLAELIPAFYVDLALYALIFGSAILTLIFAAINSRKIAGYLSTKRIHPLCVRSFFSSWGVIVFTLIMLGNMVLLLLI